jgi:hypothetical protein
MPDFDQARGQIDAVVDAAVHAHAAERIVDMRISLDLSRTIGHKRARYCIFIARLHSHLFAISGKEWRHVCS